MRTHRRREEQSKAEAKIAAAAAIASVHFGGDVSAVPSIVEKVKEMKGDLIMWRIVATCQVTGYREYMVKLFWDDEALGRRVLGDYYAKHAHPVSLEFTKVPMDTPMVEDPPLCVDCNKIHEVSSGNVCQPCVPRLPSPSLRQPS
jgi:hypothetical protein